jgi:4-carboxymuconolactone decarboxylase
MTALAMHRMLPPAGRALFEELAAKRKARGEGFGGPYIALLNHPEFARRIEEMGFFLKFDGVLPRPAYQFIVLSVAQATGAAFEWQRSRAARTSCGPFPRDSWGQRQTDRWLVEIVVLSGFYQMFAAINQAFDIKAQAKEN